MDKAIRRVPEWMAENEYVKFEGKFNLVGQAGISDTKVL